MLEMHLDTKLKKNMTYLHRRGFHVSDGANERSNDDGAGYTPNRCSSTF